MLVPAVIELSFDPWLRVGDMTLRWQALGVAMAILAALVLAALISRYPSARDALFRVRATPGLHRPLDRRLIGGSFPDAPLVAGEEARPPAIAFDDLPYVVLGIVPGAIIGGRAVHALGYLDVYAASPMTLVEPTAGSLSLLGAVLGGSFSAAGLCWLLGASVRQWADAAALPLLVAVGLGKLAQLLGGSGQGAAWDGPWALAFVGDGPWVSALPDTPAHPAQVYEGVLALLGIPVVVWLAGRRPRGGLLGPGGRLYLAALGWFLLGRIVVGFSWRDDRLLGPLNVEQALAAAALLALAAAVTGGVLRSRRRPGYRGA